MSKQTKKPAPVAAITAPAANTSTAPTVPAANMLTAAPNATMIAPNAPIATMTAPNAPIVLPVTQSAQLVASAPLLSASSSSSSSSLGKTPPTLLDMINSVNSAYTSAGWTTIVMYPIKSINDIIAKKNGAKRFHFVQVMPAEAAGTGRYIGQQKNDFIQNALSNQADPVHAIVSTELRRGEYKIRLSFSNPNTDAAVRL